MQVDEKKLEEIIRRVISEQMTLGGKAFEKVVDQASGVITVKAATVVPEPFDTGKPGDKVYISDVVTLEESPRLMFGIMEMKEQASFDWTLKYDEVDYVIDGTLEIIVNGKTSRAHKGDILFIPKNTTVTFNTPDETRFMYVTYPANWADQ